MLSLPAGSYTSCLQNAKLFWVKIVVPEVLFHNDPLPCTSICYLLFPMRLGYWIFELLTFHLIVCLYFMLWTHNYSFNICFSNTNFRLYTKQIMTCYGRTIYNSVEVYILARTKMEWNPNPPLVIWISRWQRVTYKVNNTKYIFE